MKDLLSSIANVRKDFTTVKDVLSAASVGSKPSEVHTSEPDIPFANFSPLVERSILKSTISNGLIDFELS